MTIHRWPDLSPLEVAILAYLAHGNAADARSIASSLSKFVATTPEAVERALSSLDARGSVTERDNAWRRV